MFLIQLAAESHKIIERDIVHLLIAAGGDGNTAVFRFLVAQDDNERIAGIVELLDLVAHIADRESTRLNSSHPTTSRMPSSA